MARILITSALPYINGIKHLGNLIGSQLPSDAYARYMRARGHEVLLICATDEHGTPAELAAAKPYWLGQRVAIIGHDALAQSYGEALKGLGAAPEHHDATRVTLAGLQAAQAALS